MSPPKLLGNNNPCSNTSRQNKDDTHKKIMVNSATKRKLFFQNQKIKNTSDVDRFRFSQIL